MQILILIFIILVGACNNETVKETILNEEINFPSTNNDIYKTPDGYKLVWSDEFNGTEIDKNNWTYDLGASGWGNNEWQRYTSSSKNSFVSNGMLVIKAIKTSGGMGGYTSARLKTEGKQYFHHGIIVARIKVPYGQGIWPAFWMLGKNFPSAGWPRCGEIDIMEVVGGDATKESTVHGTLHWGSSFNNKSSEGGKFIHTENLSKDWHYYEVEWDENRISIKFDGQIYFSKQVYSLKDYFNHPFFIILNIAVGGNWPGYPDKTTTFPQYMFVDWVRYYQKI